MSDPSADAAAFEQFLAAGHLPQWLPPVLATLSDRQAPDAAAGWRQRIVEAARQVPFAVVHDWQARAVVPMMAAAGQPDAAHLQHLQHLHARAAADERFEEADWRAAIEPVLRELYQHAYGYAEAYATAHASASAYAEANNFSPDGAVKFADSYATDSTNANRQSYAESNAVAHAALLAAAYAASDVKAYAEAYPFALLNACAHAAANRSAGVEDSAAESDPAARRQAAYARLADGLLGSLAREN